MDQIPKKLQIYPNLKKIIFGQEKYWAVHLQKLYKELCQVKPPQLIRKKNPDPYVYVETGSKNRSGGLNVGNKVVPFMHLQLLVRGAWCICWTSVLYGCKLLTIFGKKAFQSWLQADCRDRPLFRHHSGTPLSAYPLRSMGMQTASPDYP